MNEADFPVRTQCRTLGVSASGYYAWLERPPSRRALGNAVMTERIRAIHANSDITYGIFTVRADLIAPLVPGMNIPPESAARLIPCRPRSLCVLMIRLRRQIYLFNQVLVVDISAIVVDNFVHKLWIV